MKAMMKLAGASKFFQRSDRKKDTMSEQQKIFHLQQQMLAEQIGLDKHEIEPARWLFDQTRLMRMPEDWTRQLTNNGAQLTYVNLKTGEQSLEHPNLNLFKIFYYERMANDNAVHTFNDKNRKLLPHIEEKLTRQMIGLSSKRKQAQKVNLKRDQQGKVITSKTERLAPDTTKLMNSRNYLLKSIVDKVVTRQELWGYGKRAKQYQLILEKKGKNDTVASPEEKPQNEETLQIMDRIYQEAYEFYATQYEVLVDIPSKMDEKTERLLTPETVAMNIHLLSIDRHQIEQYWLARVASCLYLPPMWRRIRGKLFDQYLYEPTEQVFDLHPSFTYILEQRNLFMQRWSSLSLEKQRFYLSWRQMKFIDFFQRTFHIDMYNFLENDTRKQKKKQKHINDWLIVQGLVQTDIPPEMYCLGEQVEQFWQGKVFPDEHWSPSISPYGEVLWNHNITKICLEGFPYEKELKKHLQTASSIYVDEDVQYDKIYDNFSKFPQFQQKFLEKCQRQKLAFLNHYVGEFEPTSYQIPESMPKKPEDFMDTIFFCPYNFEAEWEDKPLWLEICHAKKMRIVLSQLSQQSQNIDLIWNQVRQMYLDMTKKAEPHNYDNIKETLPDKMTKQQLFKFIDYGFNIRQREDRLKKQKKQQAPKQVQQDDDIFGSSQSQIDLNQLSTEEDKPQFDLPQTNKIILMKDEQSIEEPSIEPISVKTPSSSENDSLRISDSNVIMKPKAVQQEFVEDEAYLDVKISMKKKKNLKIHKFSRQKSSEITERVKNVQDIQADQTRIKCKNDLLLSNLKKQQLPSKINLLQESPIKKLKEKTETFDWQSASISGFNSVMSTYTNGDVVKIIQGRPKKQKQKTQQSSKEDARQKTIEQSPVAIILPQRHTTTSVETQEEIVDFPPLVKQSIRDDPLLRHVDTFRDVTQFCRSFGQSRLSTAEPSKQMRRIDDDLDRQLIKSSERMLRSSSIGVSRQKSQNKRQTGLQQTRMTVSSSNFCRGCVSSTASHLLNNNAITTRMAFSRMETRKQLYLKNRGCKNFIQK